jgi:hypothetical protein
MRTVGVLLIAIGLLMVFGAFNMSTSVYSFGGGEVNNLGMLQKQMMVLQTGLSFFLGGSVLFGAAAICEHRSSLAPVTAVTSEETHENDEERLAGVRRLNRIIGFTLLAAIGVLTLLIALAGRM